MTTTVPEHGIFDLECPMPSCLIDQAKSQRRFDAPGLTLHLLTWHHRGQSETRDLVAQAARYRDCEHILTEALEDLEGNSR